MSVMSVHSWRRIACREVSTSFAAARVCCTLPPRLSWGVGLGLLLVSSPPLTRVESLGSCCGVVFICPASSLCGCRCASGRRSHYSPARRNVVSILKIEKEKKSQVGPGGDISRPRWWSPRWSPTLPLSSPLPSWSRLGGSSHSCRCGTSRAPRVIAVPVPFRTHSLFGNTH